MNKYTELYDEYEAKWNIISKESEIKYLNKIFNYISHEFGEKELKKHLKKYKIDSLWDFIFNIGIYDDKIQTYLKNIINELNKDNIILTFTQVLNNYLTCNNENTMKTVMDSFITSGLIKEIQFKNNVFTIILLNNKNIVFSKLLNTSKEIELFASKCHNLCYRYIQLYKDKKNIRVVTVLEKNLYNHTRYHSFLVINGNVYDYARNLLISYENYKYLSNSKVILDTTAEELINNVDLLEQTDIDFKNNDSCEVLKLALHKQMEKNI